jgi:phytoene dehydrogenase-like protein
VEKILVKDGQAYGVRTKHGDEIHCDYVASAPYPNVVFGKMIEPASEVPTEGLKYANAMPMSVSCFSVVMMLDAKPEDLNIHSYSVFSSDQKMDTDAFWKEGKQLGNWSYLTTICLNYANPEAVPEGKTSLSITNLPLSDCFDDVNADNYFETKRKVASQMIDQVSKRLGVNLKDHIIDIEVETPVTISHYTGAYRGGIYGYQHNMSNSIVARLEDAGKNNSYIRHLVWCSSPQLAGDGMAVNINNGKIAAKIILTEMEEAK